ncbi:MAG: zinc ribbon domain-containing protein [Lachnospiraceae bacterium]|nr:zinc ribbon domain-containing protein [Lachnospiraceae bacterium]
MKCGNCGQECADDLRFCTNCGMELPELKADEEVVSAAETAEEPEAVQDVVVKEEKQPEIEEKTTGTEVIKIDEIEIEEDKNKKKKTKEEKKAEKLAKKEYTDAEKKDSVFKNPVLLGAAAVVVLFVIILIATLSGDKPFVKLTGKAIVDVYEENDKYFVALKNGDKIQLNDESMSSKTYSMDNTTLCYINENDELMIMKDGEIIKTGIEDVDGVRVSSEGDTLVYFSDLEYSKYMTNYGYEDLIQTGTLNLYYIDKKKNVEVESEVVVNSAVLSPDGETVAYVAEYDATDDFRGFYSIKGKKQEEIGKEKRVFAIADKAKYVYYMDVDRIYAQKKGKEEEKLASDLSDVTVLLNKDHTELLFNSEGKTYVSVNAGEKIKVSGKRLNSVEYPEAVATGSGTLRTERGSIYVSYTGVDTFKEKVMYSSSEDTLVYVKDNFEDEKLASDVSSYAISENYDTLVYLDDGELIKVTDFHKGGIKTDLDDDAEARSMYAAGDLKKIYYLNNDGELYCFSGKKSKKIDEDVTSVRVSEDGTYCYYVVEGEKCCYSKNGAKGKEILDDDDYSMSLYRSYGTVYMEATEKGYVDVYRLDGKELIFEYTYETNYGDGLEDFFDYFD